MLNASAVVLGWRQLLQLPPRRPNTRHMLALPETVLYTYLRRSTKCYHRLRTHPASIHLAHRSDIRTHVPAAMQPTQTQSSDSSAHKTAAAAACQLRSFSTIQVQVKTHQPTQRQYISS